jgi:ribosomal protein L40E
MISIGKILFLCVKYNQDMVSVNKSICSKCGIGNLIGSSFCCKCGSELKQPLKNQRPEYVATKPTTSNLQSKKSEVKSEMESNASHYDKQKKFSNPEKIYRRIVFGVFRCKNTLKEFRVKIEEPSSGIWSLTQASPIEGGLKAYHEKLDIEGNFEIDNYVGCPYCGAPGVIHCFCGRIFCWDSTTEQNKCPWCNEIGNISGTFNNMKAGADV